MLSSGRYLRENTVIVVSCIFCESDGENETETETDTDFCIGLHVPRKRFDAEQIIRSDND